MKPALTLLTALLLASFHALHAADANPGVTLERRGLPLLLFNNDSDDLKWPAYPEHHASGLWVPAGQYLPLFNFYLRDEMPLLDEFADRTRLAQRPKEYFCDLGSRLGPKSSFSNGPLPLTLKPNTTATVPLVLADDPAKAKETSLEILFKGEGDFAPPILTLNGRPLTELKTTRGKSDLTLTLSSAALRKSLQRGINEFGFTSAASATLTSLSVRVVP